MLATEYTWNPLTDSVIEETDGFGNVIAAYTNKPEWFGPLISQRLDGTTSQFHGDALGSTRLLTNNQGVVTDTYSYDSWGNTVATTGTTTTQYQWNGRMGYQHNSHLGDFYIRARSYAPAESRWLSVDPSFPHSTLDTYTMSALTPALTSDPSGLLTVMPSDPTVTKCALGLSSNAIWRITWDFKLKAPAPCNGFIVQKVIVSRYMKYCFCANCTCTPPTPRDICGICNLCREYTIWEAFPVAKGATVISPAGITDQWSIPPSFFVTQCGSIGLLGQSQFFCAAAADDPRTPGIGVGDLLSLWGPSKRGLGYSHGVTVEPKWWKEMKGLELEEPIKGPEANLRTVDFTFNCCPNNANFATLDVTWDGGNQGSHTNAY